MSKPNSADGSKGAAQTEKAQAADYLGQSLKRAFPLPDSGAFSDLLAALEGGQEMRR